jgi:hypothetical protein
MIQSRRKFLVGCGAAAIASGRASGPALAAAATGKGLTSLRRREGYVMLEDLNQEIFEPFVHSRFAVYDEARNKVTMELLEVSGNSSNPKIENFSLIFRGPVQPLLPQKIYTFDHPKIGAFALFIVPIALQPDGLRYQAVFNRLREEPKKPS